MNKRELALPGMVAGAVNAFTAPARSMQSFVDEDGNVTSNFNAPEEAVNVAMNMMGGGIGTSRVAPIPNGSLGMNVYHGSPHRFPPTVKNPLGEFDPTKIGTGEGAQAYGHGLYFAENPGVAQAYKDQLSPRTIKGDASGVGNWADWAAKGADDMPDAMRKIDDLVAKSAQDPAPKGFQSWSDFAEATKRETQSRFGGNLYKVDLPDEQIAKMLDWDKPLTATPNGRAALDGLIPKLDKESVKLLKQDAGRLDGSGLVTWAQRVYGKEGASDYLQSHGIPGIRYLDQGSRSGGAGTSNFVVFDPKHMNIIGRE
jgi:hypothetical protein